MPAPELLPHAVEFDRVYTGLQPSNLLALGHLRVRIRYCWPKYIRCNFIRSNYFRRNFDLQRAADYLRPVRESMCSPFFCQIAEASPGLAANGTSATTFTPSPHRDSAQGNPLPLIQPPEPCMANRSALARAECCIAWQSNSRSPTRAGQEPAAATRLEAQRPYSRY